MHKLLWAEAGHAAGLMDVLNGVLSPDAQGGHQDALRHLGGLEGLLVGFRLFPTPPPALCSYSWLWLCTLQRTKSALQRMRHEHSPFIAVAHVLSSDHTARSSQGLCASCTNKMQNGPCLLQAYEGKEMDVLSP